MAQTPALLYNDAGTIDYTPSGAVAAGAVVVLGSTPLIAPVAIAAGVKGCLVDEGVWKIPQAAETIHAGDSVYWDDNGSPYGGTALSGCVTETATSNYLLGICAEDTTATTTYCKVKLTSATRTATIAGAVTADSITGGSTSLPIVAAAGSAAVGKPVSVTGGAGAATYEGGAASLVGGVGTTSGAGGAASVTGGAGGTSGAGGALTLAAGAGGTTSGAAGAATVTGGAALSAAGNVAGGSVTVVGGIGKGTSAGGAVALTGGLGGPTSGAGGAIALTGGAGGTTTGAGGAIAIVSGAGTNNASGGAVSIDSGAPHGTGVGGAITIGATNALSITFGKAPRYPVTAVTATASGVIGNSNNCSEGINIVAGADDTAPVVLPASVAGAWCIIKSTVAAKNLIVYPPVNSTINNVGANNAYNMVADVGCSMFVCSNATQWYSLPLVSS